VIFYRDYCASMFYIFGYTLVRPFLYFDPPTLLRPKLYFDLNFTSTCATRPIRNPDLTKGRSTETFELMHYNAYPYFWKYRLGGKTASHLLLESMIFTKKKISRKLGKNKISNIDCPGMPIFSGSALRLSGLVEA